MGNSATKEQRPPRLTASDQPFAVHDSGPSSPTRSSLTDRFSQGNSESGPDGRRARQDFFSSMGVANDEDRLPQGTEWRKETKQEREARKLEKERVARAKDRERSMREEHVDGGYLVTQGTYTGTEDFNKGIVRHLILERRIAPFWRGLNDHQDSWTENQLVAAARGLPIPAPDEIPVDDNDLAGGLESPSPRSQFQPQPHAQSASSIATSSGPSLTPRVQSQNADSSHLLPPTPAGFSSSPNPPSSLGSALSKGRSKTFATLTNSSKGQTAELRPREIRLPRDPFVNGQRLEAHLYKDVAECPICFIYYPPYLNKTRCCDQEMCSECFVQIKRPDPHPPEHQDPSAPPPPPEEVETRTADFVSEPSTCPFCKVPQFGITYEPPSFRRGLAYANNATGGFGDQQSSGMSSASSLVSSEDNSRIAPPTEPGRRRTTSISATSSSVITTDQIRPDWADKLAAARAHAARRSAAATALHTAAYMLNNRGNEDGRGFGGFGRRGLLRRTSGGDASNPGQSSSAHLFALMSERNALASANNEYNQGEASGLRGGGPRRGRMDELEDLMMMEAIRLSLASEEERRRREDKEAKKDAKKKDKEAKKAEKEAQKAAKRNGPYPGSANASMSALNESYRDARRGRGNGMDGQQLSSSISSSLPSPSSNPQIHLERARAQIQSENSPAPSPGFFNSTPSKPSHLRTQSNVSSSASSIDGASPPASLLQDPREPGSSLDVSPAGSRVNIAGPGLAQDNFVPGVPPNGGAGTEPMFNFRSLAAMVGHEDEDHQAGSSETESTHPQSSSNHVAGPNTVHAEPSRTAEGIGDVENKALQI